MWSVCADGDSPREDATLIIRDRLGRQIFIIIDGRELVVLLVERYQK